MFQDLPSSENMAQKMGPPTPGAVPKFVKLVSTDRGEFLPSVFYEDPREFLPPAGPLGQIHAWGIYPYDSDNYPDFDGVAAMKRLMKYQMNYEKRKRPEDQFMDVLLQKKRKELEVVDLGKRPKRDVIIKITMKFLNDAKGEPRIWRRFRVSSGIKLSALQDKAISPIMGWVRNLHAYTFTDFRDGSLYGPEGANSVDVSHIAQIGYQWLPDDKYMLAHLFENEGDKIGYLYDFGDKWIHELEIEKILPVEVSDGEIRIIGGKGMCPGENMVGTYRFAKWLKEYDAASVGAKMNEKRELLNAPNYKDKEHTQQPTRPFDPSTFSTSDAQSRLVAALATKNSVRTGMRSFNVPMPSNNWRSDGANAHGPSNNNTTGPTSDGRFLLEEWGKKQGQTVDREYVQGTERGSGYWAETRTDGKDQRRATVCGACGKPGKEELKMCTGCRDIFYCSAEHQKAHWKAAHKKQCSRKHLAPK